MHKKRSSALFLAMIDSEYPIPKFRFNRFLVLLFYVAMSLYAFKATKHPFTV